MSSVDRVVIYGPTCNRSHDVVRNHFLNKFNSNKSLILVIKLNFYQGKNVFTYNFKLL